MLHFKTPSNRDCFIDRDKIIAVVSLDTASSSLQNEFGDSRIFLEGGGTIAVRSSPEEILQEMPQIQEKH